MTSSKFHKYGFVDQEFYEKALEYLPILTIDLVLQDTDGNFVLVKRKNPPLKNTFWTPGGRIHKGERSKLAAVRKCKEELGISTSFVNWNFIGFFEGNFRQNAFNTPYGSHTVSLVYHHQLGINPRDIHLDDQSSDFKLSTSLPAQFIDLFQKSLITQNY